MQDDPPHDAPPLGAHLMTPRRGYTHHGIYVGSGRVIHYAGFHRWLQTGPVEEISLEAFGDGRPVIVKPHSTPKFSGADAVARARSRLGENSYRFWTNNCEHLVEWCISGRNISMQVDELIARVGARFAALPSLFGAARSGAN